MRGYEHYALIRDGIRRMKATGADVVLIDRQFAPKVNAKPEIGACRLNQPAGYFNKDAS